VQARGAAESIVAPAREEIVVARLPRVVLLAVLACVLAVPATASADDDHHETSDGRLSHLLGDVWTTVLAMPSANNPLSTGGCVRLGEHVVAPFGPFTPPGEAELTCTVERGTKLFLAPATSECSNVEPPPYHAEGESALRACARAADAHIVSHTITVDGAPVAVHEVVTGLLDLSLPADNVLGAPAGGAESVAHGWVALVHGLPVGTHTIQTAVTGTVFGNVIDLTVTITVVVQPRGDDDHGDEGDDDGDDGDDD
jgi:hypothetical protein